ncbi:hypothetical protein [Azospirillum sp.]|nr:hypothetical protein [Azospirillum sp.]
MARSSQNGQTPVASEPSTVGEGAPAKQAAGASRADQWVISTGNPA